MTTININRMIKHHLDINKALWEELEDIPGGPFCDSGEKYLADILYYQIDRNGEHLTKWRQLYNVLIPRKVEAPIVEDDEYPF